MRSQQEIVAHLRKVALNMHRNTEPTENQAATLIEQQARRIAELEGALSACMPYMKYPRTEPAALVTVHKKAIERARAALASAAPLAVPDGWALVPIEPTPEMQTAWDKAPFYEDIDEEFRSAYRAMIEAAPNRS